MIRPADRVNNVQEYYFSVKLKQIDKMRSEGKDVINLGIGSPDRKPAPDVIEALTQTAQLDNVHGYQSYIGIPALQSVCQLVRQKLWSGTGSCLRDPASYGIKGRYHAYINGLSESR